MVINLVGILVGTLAVVVALVVGRTWVVVEKVAYQVGMKTVVCSSKHFDGALTMSELLHGIVEVVAVVVGSPRALVSLELAIL